MSGLVAGDRKKPFLIGVAGGTASGKVGLSGVIIMIFVIIIVNLK
jgi:uridine kinase